MQPDRFQQLSESSKNALSWAFTRAQERMKTAQQANISVIVVSAADILVGIFMSHPKSSEPYQLPAHFANSDFFCHEFQRIARFDNGIQKL